MIGIICAMQLEADGILALAENKKYETINGTARSTPRSAPPRSSMFTSRR